MIAYTQLCIFCAQYFLFGMVCIFFSFATVSAESRRIRDVKVVGNRVVSEGAILSYVPYRAGERFEDAKTATAIKNLFFGLKRFKNIKIAIDPIDDYSIDLVVVVEEKYSLAEVSIYGNNHIGTKDIKERLQIETVLSVDEYDLERFSQEIRELYAQRGYQGTQIESALELDQENRARVSLLIREGKRATVTQIHFVGNAAVSSKELRSVILTKEDWVLSFLDQGGHYHPEKIDGDKYFLQQHYKNNGFLRVAVPNVDVEEESGTHNLKLTYHIVEGDQYFLGEISAAAVEQFSAEFLRWLIPLRVGDAYSIDAVRDALTQLELFWKNQGFIFAHVEPIISVDEEQKTVSIQFVSDIGNKMRLKRVRLRGNKKTRTKVVLRNLSVREGSIITQDQLDRSKMSVAALGYFDQKDGVNWKMKRLDEENVDLDLLLKEGKTGHLAATFSYGGDAAGDLRSTLAGFALKGEFSDSNFLGYGINFSLNLTFSQDEKSLLFHVAQPWLFDRPIYGAIDAYHKRPAYSIFRNVEGGSVFEKLTGGTGTFGYIFSLPSFYILNTQLLWLFGAEDVAYNRRPKARITGFDPATNELYTKQYQEVLDIQFNPGRYFFMSLRAEQDERNHPVHTSRGHRLKVGAKCAASGKRGSIGFYRLDLDYNWYTPIIGEQDLVFRFRAYMGVAGPLPDRTIPFGELFLLGGQASIRGFEFGQAGPQFLGDPLGGKKGIFVNAEFVMPVAPDLSIKLLAFYNGGAGFDNQNAKLLPSAYVVGNNFDYRHAVGFGIRVLNPMPVAIDWGFKLDPRRSFTDPRLNETGHEVHFSMSYDF